MDLMQRLALGEMSLSYPFGDRLPPVVEEELFRKGIFAALFGIKGFRRRGATNRRLERAGVEDIGAGWAFLATIAPGQIRPGGQES